MANVIPYLHFAQNGQEAITFYKGVFGGDAEVQFEGERVLHLDFQAGSLNLVKGYLYYRSSRGVPLGPKDA